MDRRDKATRQVERKGRSSSTHIQQADKRSQTGISLTHPLRVERNAEHMESSQNRLSFFVFFSKIFLVVTSHSSNRKKKWNQPQSHRTELSLFPISFLFYFCRAVGVTGHSSVGHTSPMSLFKFFSLRFYLLFLVLFFFWFFLLLAIISPGKRSKIKMAVILSSQTK
jgi:hypothetical protein